MKTVQICLATYNGEAFISEFLQSLVNQKVKEFEVLVSDDGSTDRTVDIVKSFESELEITIHLTASSVPLGPAKNFIRLLELSSADYVFLADQDDVWLSDKVSVCLQKMEDSKSTEPNTAKCVFSDYYVVDQDLCVIEKSGLSKVTSYFSVDKLMQSVEYTNFIPGCTVMVNRKLVDLAINFECNSHILMHDWWLVLVGKYHSGLFMYIQEPLVMYRQHQHNVVGASVETTLIKKISECLKSPSSKLSQLKNQFNMIRAAGYKKSFLLFIIIRCYRAAIFE